MTADLVRATGLDADLQEGCILRRRLARDVRNRRLALYWSVDRLVRMGEPAGDDCVIRLLHAVGLEHLDRRSEGGVRLREKEASCRVAVETVHRLKRRDVELKPDTL